MRSFKFTGPASRRDDRAVPTAPAEAFAKGIHPGLNPSGDRERPVFRGNDGRNNNLYPMRPLTKSRAETVRHNSAAEQGAQGGTARRGREAQQPPRRYGDQLQQHQAAATKGPRRIGSRAGWQEVGQSHWQGLCDELEDLTQTLQQLRGKVMQQWTERNQWRPPQGDTDRNSLNPWEVHRIRRARWSNQSRSSLGQSLPSHHAYSQAARTRETGKGQGKGKGPAEHPTRATMAYTTQTSIGQGPPSHTHTHTHTQAPARGQKGTGRGQAHAQGRGQGQGKAKGQGKGLGQWQPSSERVDAGEESAKVGSKGGRGTPLRMTHPRSSGRNLQHHQQQGGKGKTDDGKGGKGKGGSTQGKGKGKGNQPSGRGTPRGQNTVRSMIGR